MNQHRPKNLNLFTIHFPLPAIISILHRISGVILFFMIPIILWILDYSLTFPGYENIQEWLGTSIFKLFLWAMLIPFCYHLVAGLRHLFSDIHIGDSLKAGKLSSQLVLVVSILLVILAGVWIW